MNTPMNMPDRKKSLWPILAGTAIAIFVLAFFVLVSQQNFQILILIIELASLAVAIAIVSLVWNARWNVKDVFLVAIGLSVLFTGILDALFTLFVINSSQFQGVTYDLTLQTWIAARYIQCITLLVAFILIGRTLTKEGKYDTFALALPYAAITGILLYTILISRSFPACDTLFVGYTPFKIASEGVITFLLVIGLFFLVRRREHLDPVVWKDLVISQVLLVLGELAFVLSPTGFEFTNSLGFIIRFVSVYFIYRAIVVIGITRPFNLLFHEIQLHERALQLSEQRYRNVVEDQTELISRFRPDGTHVFVNDAYCRFFGMTREDILGKPFHPVLLPEQNVHIHKTLGSLTLERPVISDTTQMVLPDGSIRWVLWSDRAIFNADGNVIEYQSVGRDISRLRQASDALALAHRKLVLLSSITRHDIVNQLTALRSYLVLSSKLVTDPTASGYLEKMQKISGVIAEQITFTQDYEQMGTDAPLWHDLSRITGKAVSELPLQDISVKIDLDRIEVFADPLLERVFYNLLDNALRYGGEHLTTIRIFAKKSGDRLIIVMEDNGTGISAEDKTHLFTKGFGKHTGLGLFLVREILSITGIGITETGEPGKGARFEMEIPREAYRYSGDPGTP